MIEPWMGMLVLVEDAGADPAEVVSIHPRQFIDAVDGSGIDSSAVIDYNESAFYRREG